MKQPKLALGTPVRFSAVLSRQEVEPRPGQYELHWLPEARDGTGVVAGYRTLSNGYTDAWTEDEGFSRYTVKEWRHTGSVPCVVVAWHLHRKPVFVPIALLSVLEASNG